jgi:hypothetical protein
MAGSARRIALALGLLALFAVLVGRTVIAADREEVTGGSQFVSSVPGDRATLWAVGDGADGEPESQAVAQRIASAHVDRVLYLGDVYQSGTSEDFRDNYSSTYGRLARITAPTPGNHDWPNHMGGYDPYWSRALGTEPAHWYAFRAGGWTLLSINSEAPHDASSPQYRWLRDRLRRPGTCRIAFWHRPRYSAGTHHGDQDDMAPIWDALRARASIVLAGHEHDMQRFEPIDGITQFVSGAGGRSKYSVRKDDSRLAFSNDRDSGALRLRLRPGEADYAFISAEGRILDRGALQCQP